MIERPADHSSRLARGELADPEKAERLEAEHPDAFMRRREFLAKTAAVAGAAGLASVIPSPGGDGSWDVVSVGGSTVAHFSPATASEGVLTPSGTALVALEKHGLRPGRWRLDPSSAAKASPPVDPLLVVALVAHLLT